MAATYTSNREKVAAEMIARGKKALIRGGLLIEGDAKRSMKQGRYRLYHKGKHRTIEHWSSFPGRPPAVDTGRLRDSITTNWTQSGRSIAPTGPRAELTDGVYQPPAEPQRFTVVVGTNVEYGKFLELGTRHIAPRPWLRPAFEKVKSQIMQQFAK